MTRESKKLLGVAGVMILLLVVIMTCYAYEAWQDSKKAAFMSCLSSVARAASELPATEIRSVVDLSTDWKVLNDSEVAQLLSKIRPSDCGGTGEPLHDPWGNRLGAALRQADTTSKVEVRVWSGGRDREVGTADDPVIPFGESEPIGK